MTRAVLAALVLATVLAPAARSRAHLGSTKYLFVEARPGGLRVTADVEQVDAAYALGDVHADVVARSAEVSRWLTRSITVRDALGRRCAGRAPGPARALSRGGRPYLELELVYRCAGAARSLRDDAVFPDDPQHESIVRLGRDASATATVLRTGTRTLRLDAPRGAGAVARTFLTEGAHHLATGYDHLLFLLSLLLVAGEHATRTGLRRALRDVALVVTGFTLGHSVTLAAAALDVVVLPVRPVETAIAASIVVVALWNLLRPEKRRALPWVAAAFGLVHGFGFSSVLRELVLPRGERVLALASFNVGIELAQLAFVAVVLVPLAAWARRDARSYDRWAVRVGSVAIALLASFWVVTRALGLNLG